MAIAVLVVVAIFTVWQFALLVRDVKNRRKNKSAVSDKVDDLKGDN